MIKFKEFKELIEDSHPHQNLYFFRDEILTKLDPSLTNEQKIESIETKYLTEYMMVFSKNISYFKEQKIEVLEDLRMFSLNLLSSSKDYIEFIKKAKKHPKANITLYDAYLSKANEISNNFTKINKIITEIKNQKMENPLFFK